MPTHIALGFETFVLHSIFLGTFYGGHHLIIDITNDCKFFSRAIPDAL